MNMPGDGKKRRYASAGRNAAADTRARRVLAAARALFARHGYAATTIEAVAREAGVSVQSVYARFGGKAALIRDQLDDIDQLAGLGELRAVVGDPTADPRAQAAALARFIGRLVEGAGDLIAAAETSADPELRALVAGGAERHRMGVARLAAQWAERGVLRPGLSAADAGVIVAAHCSTAVYADLRRTHGWSVGECETWLSEAVARLVLTKLT